MDETEFLTHFGVRGMKWGIRKESASSSSGRSSAKSQAPVNTHSKLRVAGAATGVALLGAGAAAAAIYLKRKGEVPLPELPKPTIKTNTFVVDRNGLRFRYKMPSVPSPQDIMRPSMPQPKTIDEIKKALEDPDHLWEF